MKQSQASIKRTIKNLSKIVDETGDPITSRMAYFAKETLRWAVEDTVGWDRPEVDIYKEIMYLSGELVKVKKQ